MPMSGNTRLSGNELYEDGMDTGGDEEDEDEFDESYSSGRPSTSRVVLTGGKNLKKRNATSTGRKKVAISFLSDKSKRLVCFTKRKGGLMKKVKHITP